MHYTNLTYLEINLQNLVNNYQLFKAVAGQSKVIPVIKANAYGHGSVQCAKTLEQQKVYKLAVATEKEALTLKENNIQVPLIVIGHTKDTSLENCAKQDIEVALYDENQIIHLEQYPTLNTLKVHIKVETGMGRLGFRKDQIESVIRRCKNIPNIKVTGIYSHFADAETPENTHTQNQINRFNQAVEYIQTNHPDTYDSLEDIHMAATAAALSYPQSKYSSIRLGIGLYGLWPSSETHLLAKHSNKVPYPKLKPVLSWHTHICHIQTIEKNETVGYGCTYKANNQTKVATLPIGYADGLPRNLSNKGQVLIQGTPCNIIGRICMNLCMVDVTHLPEVKRMETVTIIGRDNTLKNNISAEDVAKWSETINYEIVTRINWDIPKKFITHRDLNPGANE